MQTTLKYSTLKAADKF